MTVIEFVFLVLGVICLLDYIIYSIILYQCKELVHLFGLSTEMQIRRYLEILLIIIITAIFVYKFINLGGLI